MKGITSSGFKFEVDVEKLDDMRVLDMVVEISEGNLLLLSPLAKKILGEDQREELYRHLESKEGRVSVERVSEELTEIFNAGNAGKNSSSSPE